MSKEWKELQHKIPNQQIGDENFIDLALRENQWLSTCTETKITADEFYSMHRYSALGEASYRCYIIEKMNFIKEFTSAENFEKALKNILLGKKIDYEVPIEFTRHLIKDIRERGRIALEKNKNLREIAVNKLQTV